jgi:heparan-alpha-glucosaminide N-acetyltransferase
MATEAAQSKRLLSLDVYRGFTMFLMVSAGFGLSTLADNPGWEWLARQVDHAAWAGCTVWDLIQPSFIFIVGVAMPFAFAARSARGESRAHQFSHAWKRSLILLLLGVGRYVLHTDKFIFDMTTVLQQIAVAYFFAFFLLGRKLSTQVIVALLILLVDWALFQFWPGVTEAGAYAKNANFHSAVELWGWGRLQSGGYAAFNAFGSIATVIFGIMAGDLLRTQLSGSRKTGCLVLAGLAMIVAGWLLSPAIPIVKRIWTPSWTIYSAGWASLLLGAFYWIIEVRDKRAWSFPFMVVGMNSIAIYMLVSLLRGPVKGWTWTFFGPLLETMGDAGTIVHYCMVLLVFWYILYWMYQRRIFLKVG